MLLSDLGWFAVDAMMVVPRRDVIGGSTDGASNE
jgi:hypothetical protein